MIDAPPPPTVAPADAPATPPRDFAREQWLVQRARLAQSVKMRYAISVVAMAAALQAVLVGSGAHWAAIACTTLPLLVNVPAHRALRGRRARAWHYWALLGADAVAIAGTVAAGGRVGYVGLLFFIVVGVAHGFGFPRAGRTWHLLACVLYPAARWIGTGGADPWAILLETSALASLGWLALQAPMRVTARVRNARRAIGALERGDFTVRLPTRRADDLGFLAASLNRTAESLELARRDATATTDRMHAVARAAAAVLAADSPRVLHDVLREATSSVLAFDAFSFGVYDGAAHTLTYFDARSGDESLPVPVAGRPSEVVIRERRSSVTLAEGRGAALRGGQGTRAETVVRTPILAGDAVLGVVTVQSCSPHAYAAQDVEVLEALAALAATALRNIQLVCELRRSRAALAHQAFHDSLTGLANRARFRARLGDALAAGASKVAVLALDLDGFKRVNDSLGHAAGDALLKQVADRLLNATRGCDAVARIGGDEFAVLLANVRGLTDAEVVADRIVRSLRLPFSVEGASVEIGSSVGLAWAGTTTADSVPVPVDERLVAELLRDADLALYDAKLRGKNRYVVWEPAMHAAAVERIQLETDLRAAVPHGQLRVHYQTIVALEGGEVIGAEALARWEHPRRGLVAPADFIPLAEETGLIHAVGGWVLAEACRQAADWRRRGVVDDAFTITVNVSAKQLARASFPDEVARALRDAGLDPAALVLELTESAIVESTGEVVDRLHALKALGVRLAIDDFGTGHSALGYLRHFPIDVLKIDRSFVEGVTRGGTGSALARAIVALADAMQLRTVAEGIEDPAQRDTLLAMGCRLGQGFHFARPVDAEALERSLPGR